MDDESRFCYACNSFHRASAECRAIYLGQPESNKPTEIVLGHGMIDIGSITYEGRTGLLLRRRDFYIEVGQPGGIQNETYEPKKGDVVIWFDNGDLGNTLATILDEVREDLAKNANKVMSDG